MPVLVRKKQQALARGGSGGPLRAQAEGNAQGALAQAQAQARAVVVAQAVAQAREHTDRLYQARTWAQVRGQAECRRIMADRARAQIQAKSQHLYDNVTATGGGAGAHNGRGTGERAYGGGDSEG